MSKKENILTLSEDTLGQIKEQMLPVDDTEVMAEFFKALSDPTRLSIVNALQIHEWLCVSDLVELLGMSKSALSHQLCYMRLNKLVRVKRDGRHVFYALDDDHVDQVFALALSHVNEGYNKNE